MLNVNFNPFPVLSTERLILREVNDDDVNEIFFLRSDKRVMKYLEREQAKSPEEALAYIKKISGQQKNNENILWGITLKGEKILSGTIGFWNITKEHYRAEIGYVLHPDHHGKGIMKEALSAVIDYGFTRRKLHSVEANANPENAASIKLLEQCNFIREGYFKENYFYTGKFSDSVVYSILTPNKTLDLC